MKRVHSTVRLTWSARRRRHDLWGAGDDLIYGQYGDDVIFGDDGADIIYGQDVDDQLSAGSGRDELSLMVSRDRLMGVSGVNLLVGGEIRTPFSGLGLIPSVGWLEMTSTQLTVAAATPAF